MKKYKVKYENILLIIYPFIFILLLLNIRHLLELIINQDVNKGLSVLNTLTIFIINIEMLTYITDKKDIL